MAGSVATTFGDEEGGTISDINVTPLVDVTLVLLIVFMITVPAIVGSAQLKVDLPPSISADPLVADLPLRMTVRREGDKISLYLNDQPTDEVLLKKLVADILQQGSPPSVLLAADKSVAYGEVVKVIDLLTGLGLKKVSLETKRVVAN
jgi:biopolymer transport protein ExbD